MTFDWLTFIDLYRDHYSAWIEGKIGKLIQFLKDILHTGTKLSLIVDAIKRIQI